MTFDESKHPRNGDGKFTNGSARKEVSNLPSASRLMRNYEEKFGDKKKMSPAEKIASVHIEAGQDNILPELNEEDLSKIGVNKNKPVLVKSNIYERNLLEHSDISSNETNAILGNALYSKNNQIVAGKHPSGRYYIFYAKTHYTSKKGKPIYGTVAVDVANNQNNFEVVHWHFVRENSMRSVDKNFKK